MPITLQDKVDKEISKLLQQGHIEKLEECSDKYFVSPIETVFSHLKFFFVYEKNSYQTIFIYENFMISIFLTEIKIMFLNVNMPSIIDILI